MLVVVTKVKPREMVCATINRSFTADLVPRTFESSAQLAENAFNGRCDSKHFGRSKGGIELRGQPIGVALYGLFTAA